MGAVLDADGRYITRLDRHAEMEQRPVGARAPCHHRRWSASVGDGHEAFATELSAAAVYASPVTAAAAAVKVSSQPDTTTAISRGRSMCR